MDAPELIERFLSQEQVWPSLLPSTRAAGAVLLLLRTLSLQLFCVCMVLANTPPCTRTLAPWLQDLSAKRNAFHMLTTHSPERAAAYLFNHLDNLPLWGDILQMAVLELIRKVGAAAWGVDTGRRLMQQHMCVERPDEQPTHKLQAPHTILPCPHDPAHPHHQVCVSNPESKGKYIKIILALLQSSSTAVVYECAGTLVALSQAPTAIRAAANCYCQLLVNQSDNNVKLIVLVSAHKRCCDGIVYPRPARARRKAFLAVQRADPPAPLPPPGPAD